MRNMETHPAPYNQWEPPPPPPPPDFGWGGGGAAFPPNGFPHHPHDRLHNRHFSGPPDHFNGPPDHFNAPPDHFNAPPDHFNAPPDHFNGPPGHFNAPPDSFNDFNGPPGHFDGSGNGDFSHPKPNFLRKRKFDRPDMNGNYVKLYVEPVPRNLCQAEVGHLFDDFGHIIEVVLLTDKKTGLRQEYCFVKYTSIEEADRAITALHNQFTFPGAMAPLKVRYADGERKRLGLEHIVQQDTSLSRPGPLQHDSSFPRPGLLQHDSTFSRPVPAETEHKVYVNGLNREASKEEVTELFSSYGDVVDIYLMRDELKQNRGCGFVGFTQRCMAMAAINGLNGTYMMRGCDKPLVVRFADPKKPKIGDFRQPPHPVDTRRNIVSIPSHGGNLSTSTKLSSTGEQAGSYCPVANQSRCPPHETKQNLTFSPSRLSQMSMQESQILRSPKACTDVEQNAALQSSEHGSWNLSGIDYSEAFGECDWSEHICPDGDKYYFNCITSESRWEKPEEFAACEHRIQRLKSHPHCVEPSPTEENHMTTPQCPKKSCALEKPQATVSCAVEHNREVEPDEPSSTSGPAFVQ